MDAAYQNQQWLDSVFPPSRTDAFFDALFGGAEEGAYDIRLRYLTASERELRMRFELRQRPGKCLKCNLTHGLPQVFARHPVLDVAGVAQKLAAARGWENSRWELGPIEEESAELHAIPLTIRKE